MFGRSFITYLLQSTAERVRPTTTFVDRSLSGWKLAVKMIPETAMAIDHWVLALLP